jgi:flagellar basal body-associated protein FliL
MNGIYLILIGVLLSVMTGFYFYFFFTSDSKIKDASDGKLTADQIKSMKKLYLIGLIINIICILVPILFIFLMYRSAKSKSNFLPPNLMKIQQGSSKNKWMAYIFGVITIILASVSIFATSELYFSIHHIGATQKLGANVSVKDGHMRKILIILASSALMCVLMIAASFFLGGKKKQNDKVYPGSNQLLSDNPVLG